MASFNKVFFRGLITLLPITLTIYILYSAIIILENILGSLLRYLFPYYYIPGFGFFLTLTLIYLFGLLLNNYITGRALLALEDRLTKVPLIKAVYSPLRDLMNLFSQSGKKDMGSVVLVQLPHMGMQMLGIVTRENINDLQLPASTDQHIAVYFPFSYALGGNTFLVPRSSITEIDMPIEKAMSLAITAWVKVEKNQSEHSNV